MCTVFYHMYIYVQFYFDVTFFENICFWQTKQQGVRHGPSVEYTMYRDSEYQDGSISTNQYLSRKLEKADPGRCPAKTNPLPDTGPMA